MDDARYAQLPPQVAELRRCERRWSDIERATGATQSEPRAVRKLAQERGDAFSPNGCNVEFRAPEAAG